MHHTSTAIKVGLGDSGILCKFCIISHTSLSALDYGTPRCKQFLFTHFSCLCVLLWHSQPLYVLYSELHALISTHVAGLQLHDQTSALATPDTILFLICSLLFGLVFFFFSPIIIASFPPSALVSESIVMVIV